MKSIYCLRAKRSLCYNTPALKYRSKLNEFKIEVEHDNQEIVVVSGFKPPQQDENGIVYVGVIPFLLDPAILAG